MITPSNLTKGDLIGLVSPASAIEAPVLNNAAALIKRMGYRVITGKHVLDKYHQFAGTDENRAADFQQMLDQTEVRMILCTRGGYGTMRIIDKLDFTRFMEHPKWIVGFSDITAIQNHLYTVHGVESIHGIMPLNYPECGNICTAIDKLFQVVSGKNPNYAVPAHPLNRPGKSQGVLVGGNLAIITSQIGSVSEIDTDGRILFLEEVDEKLYRFDRMMLTLKRAGKLSNLAGLVVGGLTEMTDSAKGYGNNAEEIVADAVKEFDFPVCFAFPAGHIKENYPLIIGREVALDVREQSVRLDFK
ncbi:MAG: LD-carboxypeptidase [Bacteroidales bacterium]|nr:LD-carboxypeptidase [Bacteroidales bacterium]